MDKVFVVTCGNYSDSRAVAVFSTLQLAAAYIKTANDLRTEWGERYDLGVYKLDMPPEKWVYTVVRMREDGEVLETQTYVRHGDDNRGDHEAYDWRKNFYTTVETDDKHRAIKVAKERHALIISLDIWGDKKALRELFDNRQSKQ